MAKGFEIRLYIPRTATTEEVDFAVLKHLEGLEALIPGECQTKDVLSDAVNIGSRRLLLGTTPDKRVPFEPEYLKLKEDFDRLQEAFEKVANGLAEKESELSKKDRMLEDLRGRLVNVREALDDAKGERDFMRRKNDELHGKLDALRAELARESTEKRRPAAPSCDLETALDRWKKVSERLSEVKADRDRLCEENMELRRRFAAMKKLLSEEAKP